MIRNTCIGIAALLLAAHPIWAEGPITVISVTGDAWSRPDSGAWNPLKAGAELAEGQWVRTGAESALRLLEPDGQIRRIGADQELPIGDTPDTGGGDSAFSFFSLLREMFGDAQRNRTAASRGTDDTAWLNNYYQGTWQVLIQKPRLSPEDIPHVFETAAHFTQPDHRNRPAALLTKLAESDPGNPGFARVAGQAIRALGEPGHLEVLQVKGDRYLPVTSGDSLGSGDRLRLRYTANSETYLYVFVHSVPRQGPPETMQIFPLDGPVVIPANLETLLPSETGTYRLDDTPGSELIWAWSCAGPIAPALAQQRVAQGLAQGMPLDPAMLRDRAPNGCVQAFGYALRHR